MLRLFAIPQNVYAQVDNAQTQVDPAIGETDASACSFVPAQSYNFGLHLSAVFIILIISALGMFATIWLGRTKQSTTVAKILEALKMFGIGVIAATAWIHLLPDAVDQFSNPCLGSGWAEYGINYVGLFALIAAFTIQVIEQAAISRKEERCILTSYQDPNFTVTDVENQEADVFGVAVIKDAKSHSHAHEIEVFLLEQNINTVIIEMGILLHSLVIGVNLGIIDDDGLTTLLIAISFHQLFEGMALGALISSANLEWRTKITLGLAYPLTTPLGIAIGIIVRDSFNSNSPDLIVIQGILTSLCLGILMYNTYVELIGGEINRNPVFKAYSVQFKSFCYFMMFVGAAAMAVVGIWA